MSILLVLGAHCKLTVGFPQSWDAAFNWLFDGGLGVRCFFAISGLLITWLLLAEADRGRGVNLRHFYARRALRILPVYFVFLAVLALLQVVTPFRQSGSVWFQNWLFLTNFSPEPNWVSGHLWSIAVEEQFYLLWPSLFVALAVAAKPRTGVRLLMVPIVLAPVVRVMSYLNIGLSYFGPFFSGYSFFKYFDSLAIGCLCAILLARRRSWVEQGLVGRPKSALICALMLIFTPYVLSRWFLFGVLTVPFGSSLEGAGVALLLLQSTLFPHWGVYPLLSWRIVRHLGVLSYSIYIWQQLFCSDPSVFGLEDVWWMSFPGWLVAVFVVASASYYGLERPLFRLRARFRG